MLAMNKQLMVPVKDLRYLSLTCQQCRAELVLDMSARLHPAQDRGSLTPRDLPVL